VPPLVKVNAKYYGWRVALYIAGVMYVSVVTTALILHYGFFFTGLTPESEKRVEDIAQFAFDYSFYLNLAAVAGAAVMLYLRRQHQKQQDQGGHHHDHGSGSIGFQDLVTWFCIAVLAVGAVLYMVIG